jgi:Spy/CpxP family protein refolding chaperone
VSIRYSTLLWSLAIATSTAGISESALAQRPGAAARKEARKDARAEGRGDRGARQQRLAGEVREAFHRVVKQRLNLKDDQARRLKEVDDRYENQRNEVARDEREARQALRAALAAPAGSTDQAKVDENMGRVMKAQRRRSEILEAEQKELGTFLTPVQRAQFFAMRDNLARRIQQVRSGRGGVPPVEPDSLR